MGRQKNGTWVKIAAMVLLTAFFVVFVAATLNFSMKVFTYNYNGPVEIADGKYTGPAIGGDFTIKRKGKYVVSAKWWPEEEPGYMTGLQIKNGDEVISWMTGNMVNAEFVPKEFEPGKYRAEFVILTDDKAYRDFVADHDGGYETSGDVFEGYRDGVFDVNYSLEVEMSRSYQTITFLAGCTVYGLLMGLLIFSLCYKGSRPEYDERQKLVIGNGYKYAFYTLFALTLIYSLLCYSGMSDFMSPAIFCETAIIVGVAVFAIYTTVYDGYFAVNVMSGRMTGIFTVLFLLLLAASVINIVKGHIYAKGRFEIGIIFVLLTVVVGILLTLFFVKRKTATGEEEE
ncbi:MAG: hypothetical protein K6G72_02205 [Lachnospiraceae bacterium]|nr:hypothetical protein [Lachnospiraceae bacterium]